jgi:hypothetical protein
VPAAAPVPEPASGPLSLAEAFDLLKRTLRELDATAPTMISEDPVRERMAETSGRPEDPVFKRPRFGRLLRQANDASLVDLEKTAKGFMVTLRADVAPPADQPAAAAQPAAAEDKQGRGRRRGGRGKPRAPEAAEAPAPQLALLPRETPPAAQAAPPAAPAASGPARSPILRWRRGSRGGPELKAGVPLVGVVAVPTPPAPKAQVSKAPPPKEKVAGRKAPARRGPARRGGKKGKGGPAAK